jgi:hypothetical protein
MTAFRSIDEFTEEVDRRRDNRPNPYEGAGRRPERVVVPDADLPDSLRQAPHTLAIEVTWSRLDIAVFRSTCSCGWSAGQSFYVRSMAERWGFSHHLEPVSRRRVRPDE